MSETTTKKKPRLMSAGKAAPTTTGNEHPAASLGAAEEALSESADTQISVEPLPLWWWLQQACMGEFKPSSDAGRTT